MDNKKLTHPHDKFFKDAFSRVKTVQSFIEHYLRPQESALIDLSTLEAVKDSHINPDLQELFSDAVYAASTPGKPGHVYLLFEHKSYPDPMAGVQLLKNIAMVLQYHERQHAGEGIPVIFTTVICHGKKSLIPCKGPVYRLVPYQKCQPLFPDHRFIFFDLQAVDDDQIKGDPYLRILFKALKYIHSPDLLEKIGDILVIFKELNKDIGAYEYLLSLITYLAGAAPKKLLKKLLGRINRILKKEKNPMSNIIEDVFGDLIKERLEKATTEGMRKGREEGREEGVKIGVEKGIKIGEEKGIKIGKEKGIKIGEEKGKREGVTEKIKKKAVIRTEKVVREMAAIGLGDEIISSITGLTSEEVRKLKN